MARLRTNKAMQPLETVEQAQATPVDGMAQTIIDGMRAKWFVGTGDEVAAELRTFAERWDVDEVMISPVAGSYEEEPMDAAPGRVRMLELLTAALG